MIKTNRAESADVININAADGIHGYGSRLMEALHNAAVLLLWARLVQNHNFEEKFKKRNLGSSEPNII